MNLNTNLIIKILFVLLIIFGATYFYYNKRMGITNIVQDKRNKSEITLSTDYTGAKVNPAKIINGCFGIDCIPSIDSPIFETVKEGNAWLKDSDVIFGVNHNGIQKAYAQRILNWHEIVNDNFNEEPVVVTFCPLCGTAVSFSPLVDGKFAEFGVSGKLYNSDLVMYDRNEGNLWQQATGQAIVGPAAQRDEWLELLSTTTTTWDKWKAKYPNTLVLSKETGYSRDYSRYPYGSYESNEAVNFPVAYEDDAMHPKEIVFGINVGKLAIAYKDADLKTGRTIDNQNGIAIQIDKTDADEVTFINLNTGEKIIPLRGFWFAWVAFNPDTLVYGSN